MKRLLTVNDVVDRIEATCTSIKQVRVADNENQVFDTEVSRKDHLSESFPIAWVVIPSDFIGGLLGDQVQKSSLTQRFPIVTASGVPDGDFDGFNQMRVELLSALHGWSWEPTANPMQYVTGEPRSYDQRIVWHLSVFETEHQNALRNL